MRAYPNTLLDETYEAIVNRQMKYGATRNVPWGISESAYNVQDLEGNYQYRAFGVPGLGLKRGLADDLVVAPYATILAALVSPADAVANLKTLARRGHDRHIRLLRSHRLHHRSSAQGPHAGSSCRPTWRITRGMSLIALDNVLNGVADAAPLSRRPARAGRGPACCRSASRTSSR